jgi:serine protease Do
MKMKQIFSTMFISAVTAAAMIWGYASFVKKDNNYGGQANAQLPSNYRLTGLDENGLPPVATDFTQPSQAATPAVVHIKTKTNAKQVNNNLRYL